MRLVALRVFDFLLWRYVSAEGACFVTQSPYTPFDDLSATFLNRISGDKTHGLMSRLISGGGSAVEEPVSLFANGKYGSLGDSLHMRQTFPDGGNRLRNLTCDCASFGCQLRQCGFVCDQSPSAYHGWWLHIGSHALCVATASRCQNDQTRHDSSEVTHDTQAQRRQPEDAPIATVTARRWRHVRYHFPFSMSSPISHINSSPGPALSTTISAA
jgi:hypothetical protein